MTGRGQIADHPMFAKALEPGCGFGCNTGRIAPAPFTYASSKTENGELVWYMGEGEITDDPIPPEFFGCAGVAHIENLQDRLLAIGRAGYRHHVSITPGHVQSAVKEAFETYLGYGLL
jgi:L-fucose isomerase-like protein